MEGGEVCSLFYFFIFVKNTTKKKKEKKVARLFLFGVQNIWTH
jgi:hypothetical protein